MNLKKAGNIKYKRFGFSVNECFLSENTLLDAQINYFIQCPFNVNGRLTEFYTLLVDLKEPIETILHNIYDRTRSEIKSFISNQNYEYKLEFNLSENNLNDFIKMFNEFAKHKNIRYAEAFRLKAYNSNSLLAVSYIKQNNQYITINFYRVTSERATNLYSFHLKHKLNPHFNNSHFGRAHRALHWLDIMEFKKLKVSFYDFCGWYNGSEDKTLLNINKFKEQFTHFKIKEYSGVIYKNKLLLFIKKLKAQWNLI